jgi:GTPase SAR1 family protein
MSYRRNRQPSDVREYKVVMCGEAHVGKTSFISYVKDGRMIEAGEVTIGFDMYSKEVKGFVCSLLFDVAIFMHILIL